LAFVNAVETIMTVTTMTIEELWLSEKVKHWKSGDSDEEVDDKLPVSTFGDAISVLK
jgi:hypothetical protein